MDTSSFNKIYLLFFLYILKLSLWIYPFIAQKSVNRFPKRIVMPTTVGLVSFIPFNTIRSRKIEPYGLVNNPLFVDGLELEPLEVVAHDDNHTDISYGTNKEFYDKWEKIRKNYSVTKGQNVELAYYILTHEISTNKRLGDLEMEETTFVDHPEDIEANIKEGIERHIYNI